MWFEKLVYFYLKFLAAFLWIQVFRILFEFFCGSGSGLGERKVRSGSRQKDPDPKNTSFMQVILPGILIIHHICIEKPRVQLSPHAFIRYLPTSTVTKKGLQYPTNKALFTIILVYFITEKQKDFPPSVLSLRGRWGGGSS